MISKFQRKNLMFQILSSTDENSGMTAGEIQSRISCEGHNVSLKTIRRDLVDLSLEKGISSTGTRPDRFYQTKTYTQKHELSLNESSLQTLFIALQNLKSTSHEYFYDSATEVEMSIFKGLDKDLVKDLKSKSERYFFDYSMSGSPKNHSKKVFKKILQAIREDKVISCIYSSPYKTESQTLESRSFSPYYFLMTSSIPYVFAVDNHDGECKLLRAQRISEVTLSKQSFLRDPSIAKPNLANMIGAWRSSEKSNTTIEVICNKSVYNFFKEKQIHRSQIQKKIGDGKFQILFNCPESSELIRLISSFGGSIISIKPESIYKKVKTIWEEGLKNAA